MHDTVTIALRARVALLETARSPLEQAQALTGLLACALETLHTLAPDVRQALLERGMSAMQDFGLGAYTESLTLLRNDYSGLATLKRVVSGWKE